MKRVRYQEEGEVETINNNMARALIRLSQAKNQELNMTSKEDHDHEYDRVFVCKTCNRKFSSFQALGGHSASHKKPKLSLWENNQGFVAGNNKAKTHECSVCGVEFALGQALGGHMRRHRASNDGPAENKGGIGKKVMLFGFVLATLG